MTINKGVLCSSLNLSAAIDQTGIKHAQLVRFQMIFLLFKVPAQVVNDSLDATRLQTPQSTFLLDSICNLLGRKREPTKTLVVSLAMQLQATMQTLLQKSKANLERRIYLARTIM